MKDNRHYVFYIWKKIFRSPSWPRYALAPFYLYSVTANNMFWAAQVKYKCRSSRHFIFFAALRALSGSSGSACLLPSAAPTLSSLQVLGLLSLDGDPHGLVGTAIFHHSCCSPADPFAIPAQSSKRQGLPGKGCSDAHVAATDGFLAAEQQRRACMVDPRSVHVSERGIHVHLPVPDFQVAGWKPGPFHVVDGD
eukprot:768149-Hanusia_phi.AAC.3